MELLFKTILPIFINFLVILCVMTLQVILLPFNLLGIFLFEQMYSGTTFFKVMILTILTSLIFDSIKMAPLGAWMFSFFLSALPAGIVLKVLKLNISDFNTSITIQIARVFFISISAFVQYILYSKLIGVNSIDFKIIFSIVVVTVIYLVLILLIRNKNTPSLLQ
jgi:hypothetical protein